MSEAKRKGNPNWTKGTSGNPKGRPRADAVQTRADAARHDASLRESNADWLLAAYHDDGWYSLLTGHGTASRDKTLSVYFHSDIIDYEQGRELWRGDDLGARIVEAIVDEALREQFTFGVTDDAEGNDDEYGAELTKKVHAWWKKIGLVQCLHEVWCYERALGGGALLLGVNDGATALADPVGKSIKTLDWLTVLEPREVSPAAWYTDPFAEKFGQVSHYLLTPMGQGGTTSNTAGQKLSQTLIVHESRLIIFGGIKVSRMAQPGQYNGFGDSVFTRVWRVLRDFNTGVKGSSILMAEFGAPVFKMAGLADLVKKSDNGGKAEFIARMQALALAMSTARCALIDMTEEYTRTATPTTGLPELLEFHAKRVGAAARTPLPVLWGESPGGINASGASGDQLQLWHAQIGNEQTKKLEPAIRRITDLGLETMGGAPDEYAINFPPLTKLSRKEEADADKVEADTVCALFDRDLLERDEIRRHPSFAKRWGIKIEKHEDEDMIDPTAEDVQAALAGQGAVDPATGKPAMPGVPGTDLQKQALNGAQISSMIEVIKAVAMGEIARESGVGALMIALQITEAEAGTLIGPVGFKATVPDPPSTGGGFPGGSPKPDAPAPVKTEPPKATE